ncbi:MAG: nucleotide exchange factor GrpE [Lachnospiraceae bacterium]|nr:nucleotide exchange factor GrpE [Lachnospiraceae bacterium]
MSEEIKKDLSDAEVTEEVLEEETLKETSSGEDVMEGETTEESSEEGTSEEVEGQETADAESGAPLSRADKKAAKKKLKADKKQDALKEKIDELEDRVKRQMAEFENFRKRTEKEKASMFETGAKSVIEKILPVVDNFERGLAAVPEAEKGGAFEEGMEKIYKQLMVELEKMDVKPIPAIGEAFNPDFHNAVMQVESEEYESGVVAQELLKGYTYRDSVVRHSMVAVVGD